VAKSTKRAPDWAIDDNPYSKYGFLYCDLLKSKKYQALSKPAQLFYLVCIGNSHDDKARACLKEHVKRDNVFCGRPEYTDIEYFFEHGYFVFPARQLREYGYTRAYGWKLMQELIDAGFVEKKENNKARQQVNVYKFSTRWKNKTRATHSLQE